MKNKEERLKEREKLKEESKHINWWSKEVSIKEFKNHFKKFLDTYTPEELLEELIECGLEIDNGDDINDKE